MLATRRTLGAGGELNGKREGLMELVLLLTQGFSTVSSIWGQKAENHGWDGRGQDVAAGFFVCVFSGGVLSLELPQ